ncbi:acylneuraminate cytidylyltransferase family protein [Empedobacter tilapiae]
MKVYAIIPARSGSKGFPNKNIQLIDDRPLISYSIEFAKKIKVDKVFCSTDSVTYAEIAKKCGAEVPFLRSDLASSDIAMEEDILKDLYEKFIENKIDIPDIIVWLRPTFVFRDIDIINKGLDLIINDSSVDAVRTICESEVRLYSLKDDLLIPNFNDGGKSMIRRQDIGIGYKVFSTDIFRFNKSNLKDNFLGSKIVGLPINKICGLDIDDEVDFNIVKSIVENNRELIQNYIH